MDTSDLDSVTPEPKSYIRQRWLLLFVGFVSLVCCILGGFISLFVLGGGGEAPQPTIAISPGLDATATAKAGMTAEAIAQASPTFALTPTPLSHLDIIANTETSNKDVKGEIKIEYPVRLSPGSSDTVIVSIYLPELLVSLEPIPIERVPIPTNIPAIVGELNSYQTLIYIQEKMSVEISSPTIEVGDVYPASIQTVNINEFADPTFWSWAIVAPNTIGSHDLNIDVFRSEDRIPTWRGVLNIEVIELTPTAAPTPTNTPKPTPVSFINTPGGTATIGALGTIMAALITGIITFLAARDSFPIIGTKASYRRTLKRLHRNLAQLEEKKAKYGIDVPLKIENEIEDTQAKIVEIEARLAKIESK